MKALRIVEPKTIVINETETNIMLADDEIAVEIARVSLCGSDIKLYKGEYNGPCKYPLIFGHEWSGEIIGVSDKEEEFIVGDYVTGDCSCWCGHCDNCKRDKNLCSNIEKFGITKDGYAREMAIIKKKYLYRSNKKLPHKVLALTECFAVALHSIKGLGVRNINRRSRILIIGCGAIGTATYLLLKYYYKFDNIYICDKDENRIAAIEKVLDNDQMLIYEIEAANEINGSTYADAYKKNGFDFVFESSGTTRGLDTAIELANPLGRISYVGLDGVGVLRNVKQITMKGLTIYGSIGGTGEFEEVIEFLESNFSKVSKMVTVEKDYTNAKSAFEDMISNSSNIKCQIKFK